MYDLCGFSVQRLLRHLLDRQHRSFLKKVQEFYYNGNLKKAIELLEKGEPVVYEEGFEDYLKIQFYLLYCEILVVAVFMENKSFEIAVKKLHLIKTNI